MINKQMDEKKTIQHMKKQLLFLRQYVAQMRLHSMLDDREDILKVEDDLVSYLDYTTVMIQRNCHYDSYQNKYLKAMNRQALKQQQGEDMNLKIFRILSAIEELPDLEKKLLQDRFVKGLPTKAILLRQGDVVESTLHRRLNRACLHLAVLLCEELYII